MNIYVFDESGRCTSRAKFASSEDAEKYIKLNSFQLFKLSHDDKHIDTVYFDGENIVDIPAAPNAFSIFDYSTLSWKTTNTALIVSERTRLLAASDWTQMPDVDIPTKAEWAIYRQSLRDLTQQAGFPTDIVWPTPPQ